MEKKEEGGQILAIAIVILLIVSVLVPVMVMYTQREAVWTAKHSRNTSAFHMAEAGIEKGYLAISLTTQTWVNLQNGVPMTNYRFDTAFSDVQGGKYVVSITSGPLSQQATIISIGRDSLKKETRSLKAVYSNSPLGGVAIYAGAGAQIGGGVNVEWGAVVSPNTLNVGTRLHPQFWSASGIIGKDTDPEWPNCDSPNCCQWHAYASNSIPPAPLLDLSAYKSSATLSNCTGFGAGASPANSCYYPASQTDWNYTITGGQTIYVEGDLTVKSPGIDIVGNLLVMGNVNLPSGVWGKGNHTMVMPADAWKQYCNEWSAYQAFDAGAPAVFPGLNATYTPGTITKASTKLAVYGLLYVQKNFNNGGGGGGNSDVYGVLYSLGSSTQTAASSVDFYYNAEAAKGLQLSQIVLARRSWQDVLYGWPTGL